MDVQCIMEKCIGLFGLDYNYSVLPNSGGELSTNYPSSLVILESEKSIVDALASAVTTPCNGMTESSSVHHHVNTGVLSGSSHCSQSTNGDRDRTSPSVNLFKTESGNGKALEEEVDGGRGDAKTEKPSGNGFHDDPDSNGVLVDKNELQIELEQQEKQISLKLGLGNASLTSSESLFRLGSASITSSTNSELGSSIPENGVELTKLKELCSRARFARCRARFPVPVILYNQKNICRSATLSGGPEIYGRSSFDYLFSGGVDWKQDYDDAEDEIIVPETQSDWQLFDRVRSQDIRLLKAFQVQTIVDLMVEKKKVKFGVNVTSSEKVDKENRYSDFTIVSLPYPGCEFFKKYRDNGYNGEDLVFEWNQTHVDANIFVPPDPITASLRTDWSAYRKWDVIALTQNYLKLLLAYLRDSQNGLLIHCISGWDRTPLFVSLLRLSLWADGVIHKSLNAEQILYLTLAYDWLLFGHNLEDRLSKGEEILFFCFYFLKYIVNCEYNVEASKEVPKSQDSKIGRTRNDSDIQLDGVLLEGGSLTSPEGSSWSLSSCSSSSSKSMDNPPAYFSVESESWDDSLTVQHLKNDRNKNVQGLDSSFAQKQDETDLGPANKNNALGGSTSEALSGGRAVVSDGFNGNNSLTSIVYSNAKSDAVVPTSSNSSCEMLAPVNGNGVDAKHHRHGRTSPVAVPRPTRSSHHRHESSSSASIGSWQFITGTGSLREIISSSDPGSSHSHPSRLSLSSAIECIEASESSCTLVEELTPVEFPERHPLSSFDSNHDAPVNHSRKGNGLKHELDDDDSLVLGDEVQLVKRKSGGSTSVQPTKLGLDSRENFMSRRRERLQTVRAHFYTLYAAAIGFQFKTVNDNGSGSGGGLGSLIGTFATKVGIRSANRHTS
ncbi:unnamed protein product [Orchesella dallaii]|uniref:Myotubularin-related protein 14 n=1 Tax=Orchesella dallaii TaxID=48710 RepID=A0ABP1QPM2_9HEXA